MRRWIVLCAIALLFAYYVWSRRAVDHDRTPHQYAVETVPYTFAMQTSASFDNVPAKVDHNWHQYGSGIDRVLIDDPACVEFLRHHFGERYAAAFHQFRFRAYAADLFRYAWLYVHGGVYCDIKTILMKDLRRIFTDNARCYMVFVEHSDDLRLYNGIIATPPRNPMMLDLMNACLDIPEQYAMRYSYNCERAYAIVKGYCADSTVVPGLNRTVGQVPSIEMLIERAFPSEACGHRVDRYGYCVYIVDPATGEKLFKVRYNDYPWPKKKS